MTLALTRFPDWRTRLSAYVTETQDRAFRPGRHDCGLWPAGAVKAITGTDFARGFRGYRTLQEGIRKLEAKGFANHEQLAAARLPAIPVAFAQPGDVAVLDGEDAWPVLGIVQGPRVWVLRVSELGLVPLTAARGAFRV